MTSLYQNTGNGGIQITSERQGYFTVLNYVYDLWLPILGVTVLGLYTIYCRLENGRTIYGMSIKKLAQAAHVSDKTVSKANKMLEDCGFIRIEKPESWQKLAHYTTKLIVLDPPKEVTSEIIDRYRPRNKNGEPTKWTYELLAKWLVEDRTNSPEASLDDAEIVNERCDKASLDDAKNESSLMNPLNKLPNDFKLLANEIKKILAAPKVFEGRSTITYDPILELYDNDPEFKRFVTERLKEAVHWNGVTPEIVLLHFANVDSQPDENNKTKRLGYHYWRKKNAVTISNIGTPPKPKVVCFDPIEE